jgi:energy-coupling factor transport system permease protein
MSAPWEMLFAAERRGRLARLDPRAKLVSAICCFVLVVAASRPVSLAAIALALGLVVLWGGVGRGVARALGALVGFVVLVTLLNLVYFGIESGLIAVGKLLLAVVCFAVLLQSTPAEDLSAGLLRLGVPFTFAFTLTAGARFVPTVAREAATIRQAHRARGIALEESALGRIRGWVSILVPLVVATVARSVRLAEALEARAFGYALARTTLRELRFTPADWLFVGLTAGLVAAVAFTEMARL